MTQRTMPDAPAEAATPLGGAGSPAPTAPDEVLRRLGSAVDARAVAGRDLGEARLIDADLSGLDLSGFKLAGADLSRAKLVGTRLAGADLRGTVLFEADLSGAELLGADLTGADLTDCTAAGAGFGSAQLNGATLFGARLEDATLTQARLRGADLRSARLNRARLREADLGEANFSQAVMQETDLVRSEVRGAQFVDADLRHSRMRGISGYAQADWIGADIFGVDFCGAYLIRRTIADQNYLHEFRTQSRGNAVLYWMWWASSDCGRSFLRWGLWTAVLAVVFAGLFELVVIDYGDHPTYLSSLYYSLVTLTTLGYGDVVPASPGAQLLAMLEVVLGYVMLGGLLSIFSNKMARRAD